MRLILATVAAAATLLAAAPASSNFSGTYSVTFFLGKKHQQGTTQCLIFTPSNAVDGFPRNSGTWDSSTFSTIHGIYVQDGKYLRFYGTYKFQHGIAVLNGYVDLKTNEGGDDEWSVSRPPTPFDDGIITMTPGCTPAALGTATFTH